MRTVRGNQYYGMYVKNLIRYMLTPNRWVMYPEDGTTIELPTIYVGRKGSMMSLYLKNVLR